MKSMDYEIGGARVEPRMRLLLAVFVLCGACVNPGHPPDPEPGPDSLSYWQERVRQLKPGMTPEEVKVLRPERENGGGSGFVGTGGGFVLMYPLSSQWFVQIPFAHSEGLMAGGSILVQSTIEGGESWRWPIPERSP